MEKTPTTPSIAFLIPYGKKSAISRKELTRTCIDLGLVSEGDADRDVRRLLHKARIDYVIMNRCDGKGYYRPTHEDMLDLNRYIRQERRRAITILKNLRMAKCLYEDYKRGVL